MSAPTAQELADFSREVDVRLMQLLDRGLPVSDEEWEVVYEGDPGEREVCEHGIHNPWVNCSPCSCSMGGAGYSGFEGTLCQHGEDRNECIRCNPSI